MGPNTNVNSISFQYNGLAPEKVTFTLKDKSEKTVKSGSHFHMDPPLASNPATLVRRVFLGGTANLTDKERIARAQAMVDTSMDKAVTATGELDSLRYGRILKPRGLVDVRGAGESYDGAYYVNQVTHNIDIRKGEYKQSFTLAREGLGARKPTVSV